MLIAITGASGFVGSFTVAALHRAGHTVRALVRPTSRRDHIAPHVDDFRVGEIHDPQALAGLVAGADAVIHNAADWNALETGPVPSFERNVIASLRLLEAARQAEVEQFLFVSSVAVYHEIPGTAGGRITEETVTWPRSIYGAYKAAVESHLKGYHATWGMNTSAWRPAAIYGVDPDLKRSQWFDLIRDVTHAKRISIEQGGKITHVQDVADALALAIGDKSVAGQLYNLVDRYLYWQEVAEIARELSGSSTEIENRKGSGPKNQFDTTKAIDFFTRHGNTSALRRGTDGVRDYVRDLLPLITSPAGAGPE
jgi:nucleoside-diphosphate-sugar epimerase